MNDLKIISLAAAMLCLLFAVSYADYLEVGRAANIKDSPQSAGAIIEKAEPGTLLALLDDGEQQNGYYKTISPTQARAGWIYRTYVRRYPGALPGTAVDTASYDVMKFFTNSLTPQQQQYAARHLRLGKPQAIHERVHEGYVLAEDGRLKIPVWVQYQIKANELDGLAERTDNFQADTSIPQGYRSELTDYSGSGFDRGHMAPAEDMTRSDNVMSECFLLSNMAPQIGAGFNNGIWKSLETAVRGWVQQKGELTIIAGPVFGVVNDSVKYGTIGGNQVAVPTQFYKIIIDANNPQQIETLAFLIPHRKFTRGQYADFLCSIDDIEKATGLDFLSALPKATQDQLESTKASSAW